MPEDMSFRMPEDLPVTKRINVMVGITRSKVILLTSLYPQLYPQLRAGKLAELLNITMFQGKSSNKMDFPTFQQTDSLPCGKLYNTAMENHHLSWVNPL